MMPRIPVSFLPCEFQTDPLPSSPLNCGTGSKGIGSRAPGVRPMRTHVRASGDQCGHVVLGFVSGIFQCAGGRLHVFKGEAGHSDVSTCIRLPEPRSHRFT
jgi:hypothetical protein